MRYPRIYIDAPLQPGARIEPDERAMHYLVHVLRARTGGIVHVFNGHGGYCRARVAVAGKRGASLEVLEQVREECESSLDLTLAQGISRGQHMDYTVQKAVELGVTAIVPLLTEHSNVRLDAKRMQKRMSHWRGIIVNACEQCGRNRLPAIQPPLPLADWVRQDDNPVRLLLHPGEGKRLSALSREPGGMTLLAGPEGGLSDNEARLAMAAGYQATQLGPRVLRTETAAVTALAICQGLWGDMA